MEEIHTPKAEQEKIEKIKLQEEDKTRQDDRNKKNKRRNV